MQSYFIFLQYKYINKPEEAINKIVDNKITEVKDKKGTRCYLCRIKQIEGGISINQHQIKF